jgi:hypothetical protein
LDEDATIGTCVDVAGLETLFVDIRRPDKTLEIFVQEKLGNFLRFHAVFCVVAVTSGVLPPKQSNFRD